LISDVLGVCSTPLYAKTPPIEPFRSVRMRRRGCGCLRCSNSNCCRKHRSSATSSALGLSAHEKGQTGKRTTPVRNELPQRADLVCYFRSWAV